MITNDKLKYASKDIWGIIITAAAAALCVAIDILLKEDEHEKTVIGYVGCMYLSLLCHVLFDPVVSFDTQKFLIPKKFEFLGIVALCPVFAH